jgi:hypothetical protein
MDRYDDMPPGMPFDEINPEFVRTFRTLSKEEKRREILKIESYVDEHVPSGPLAWDMYFCLMHEAHMAGLSDDFYRLRDKIDLEKYNPFNSHNPGIVFLARWRLEAALEAERDGGGLNSAA